jgi:hypothetical protein
MQLILSISDIEEINAGIILFDPKGIYDLKHLTTYTYAGLISDTDDGVKLKEQRSYASVDTYLWEALIESAWVQIKKNPAMLMKYKGYCKYMHKSKAIIKISRHLLERIKYVLKKRLPKRPAE